MAMLEEPLAVRAAVAEQFGHCFKFRTLHRLLRAKVESTKDATHTRMAIMVMRGRPSILRSSIQTGANADGAHERP
jgi:hypothetical protein